MSIDLDEVDELSSGDLDELEKCFLSEETSDLPTKSPKSLTQSLAKGIVEEALSERSHEEELIITDPFEAVNNMEMKGTVHTNAIKKLEQEYPYIFGNQ